MLGYLQKISNANCIDRLLDLLQVGFVCLIQQVNGDQRQDAGDENVDGYAQSTLIIGEQCGGDDGRHGAAEDGAELIAE